MLFSGDSRQGLGDQKIGPASGPRKRHAAWRTRMAAALRGILWGSEFREKLQCGRDHVQSFAKARRSHSPRDPRVGATGTTLEQRNPKP